MTILSYTEICELIEAGVIEGAKYEHVNSASLDITLGDKILVESLYGYSNLYLDKKSQLPHIEFIMNSAESYILSPGEFILAHSQEIFHLPNNISAEYKLKSSMARIGLGHLLAGWCDAGWNNSVLTLELKNELRCHAIVLKPGDKIGQMIFYKHSPVPHDKSYATRGSYNGDKTVNGVKVK